MAPPNPPGLARYLALRNSIHHHCAQWHGDLDHEYHWCSDWYGACVQCAEWHLLPHAGSLESEGEGAQPCFIVWKAWAVYGKRLRGTFITLNWMRFSIFATSQTWTETMLTPTAKWTISSCTDSEEMIPMMHSTFLNIAAKMPEADAEQLQATCLASCFAPGMNSIVSGRVR